MNKNNSLPRVTVVTVILNLIKNQRVELFQRCVQSIRNQTYPEIEHLIIDGKSDDGTIRLLEELNLSFISEKDSGIYDAMNKGISKATGKYIIFINSDDAFYSPNVVEKAVQKLMEKDADVLFGKALITPNEPKRPFIKEYDVSGFYYHMPLCHQSVICKVDALKEIGMFDTSYKIAADYKSIYQLLLAGKSFVSINEAIANFSIGGISTRFLQKAKEESARVIYENLSLLDPSFSTKQAKRLAETHLLSLRLYREIKKCLHPKLQNRFSKNVLHSFLFGMRKSLIIFRLNRRSSLIKILGITIYERKK